MEKTFPKIVKKCQELHAGLKTTMMKAYYCLSTKQETFRETTNLTPRIIHWARCKAVAKTRCSMPQITHIAVQARVLIRNRCEMQYKNGQDSI